MKKCLFWISLPMMVISLFAIIFGFVILEKIVQSQAISQAIMTAENFDLWGQFPGKSEVKIYQDLSFYNITNVEDVLKSESKINADEIGPYRIQEVQNFSNFKFIKENGTVNFNYYDYFNATDKMIENQKNNYVTTFNVVLLGAWYQIKTVSRSQVALQAIYTIVQSLSKDFFYAVNQQLANTRNTISYEDYKSAFFGNAKNFINEETIHQTFFDPLYGFNASYGFYAEAMTTFPSNKSEFFMNYFNLPFFIVAYISQQYNKNIQNAFILEPPLNGPLSPENVAYNQWLDYSVTKTPLVDQLSNTTTPGYIEYGAYLNFVEKKYSSMNLSTVAKLLAYNEFMPYSPDNVYPVDDSQSLLNKENLDNIFSFKNSDDSVKYIDTTLGLNNMTESQLLWNYLNYLVDEIAFRKSLNGTAPLAGLTTIVSQEFYSVITSISQSLFSNIISMRILEEDLFGGEDCSKNLTNLLSIDGIDINKICSNPILQTNSLENIKRWMNGILYNETDFQNLLQLNETQMIQLIGSGSPFYKLILSQINKLKLQYGITQGNYKALNLLPLGVLQWYNNSVTMNFEIKKYATESIKDWDPSFKFSPEFGSFCLDNPETCQINDINYDTLLKDMNFDTLFSSLYLQDNVYIQYYQNKSANQYSKKSFVSYLRYLFTDGVFGGVIITKSLYDMIWGYQSDFLVKLKNSNYYTGGDPTLDTIFNLSRNMTKPPSLSSVTEMYSGQINYKNTREYTRLNGFDQKKIILRTNYFTGKKIVTKFVNPWAEYLDLNGTDANSFHPNFQESETPWAYIDSLSICASFYYYNKQSYDGISAYRYLLNNSITESMKYNPDNSVIYALKYNGFGNISSVMNAPLFASKPYYYQCNDTPTDMLPNIKMLNRSSKTKPSEDDILLFNESFFDIEPYSGAVTRNAQKILISALIEKDEIFDKDMFVPIYYVFRSGNLTSSVIHNIFGPLILALKLKIVIIVVFFVLLAVSIVLMVLAFVRFKKQKDEKKPLIEEFENENDFKSPEKENIS